MTRAQHQAKLGRTWPALFEEQGATLTAVAEMLLPSRVPPGEVLDQALASLEGSPLRDPLDRSLRSELSSRRPSHTS